MVANSSDSEQLEVYFVYLSYMTQMGLLVSVGQQI